MCSVRLFDIRREPRFLWGTLPQALLSGRLLPGALKAALDLLECLLYRGMSRVSRLSPLKRYALARFRAETGGVVGAVRHGVQEVGLAALRLVVGRGKVG